GGASHLVGRVWTGMCRRTLRAPVSSRPCEVLDTRGFPAKVFRKHHVQRPDADAARAKVDIVAAIPFAGKLAFLHVTYVVCFPQFASSNLEREGESQSPASSWGGARSDIRIICWPT